MTSRFANDVIIVRVLQKILLWKIVIFIEIVLHGSVSGGFNGRPHVQWPTRPQHNGPLEAPRVVTLWPVGLLQL